MKRKIFYAMGIVIGIFILLVIFVPAPEKKLESVPVATTGDIAPPVTSVATSSESISEQKPQVTSPSQSSATPSNYYTVTKVTDGDTLNLNINGKVETVRLIGINTPETVDPRKPVECFGKEASNRAKELLSGKQVAFEKDPSQGERDKYGRLLGYIVLQDGRNFNKLMIQEGYAYEYTYDLPYKYQKEFKQAELEARTGQKGLWAPNACNGSSQGAINQSSGKFYTSSHYSAQYYYPESCDGWKSLSTNYLKSFDSLEGLLAAYPKRTKSPQCN